MKRLIDNDVNLTWEIYPTKDVYKYYKKNEDLNNTISTLNSWQSENINDFITSLYLLKLGDFFCENLLSSYELKNNQGNNLFLLLAYEDKELVGTIILNNQSQNISTDFKLTDNINNLRIEYIVVNPDKQNMGIGTRLIKSITKNQSIFSFDTTTNGICADIDNENIPSQKAFLKNHYKIVLPSSHLNNYFSRYYHTSLTPNKEKKL